MLLVLYTRRLFQQMPLLKSKILQQNFSFWSCWVFLHLDALFASSQEVIFNVFLHNLDLSLTLRPGKILTFSDFVQYEEWSSTCLQVWWVFQSSWQEVGSSCCPWRLWILKNVQSIKFVKKTNLSLASIIWFLRLWLLNPTLANSRT